MHLLQNPDAYIADFAEAGADIISVHVEACPHLHRTIQLIKEQGVKAGVVLIWHTVSAVKPILDEVDLVLQMSVNPGFGGQQFIPSTLRNIQELAEYRLTHGLTYEIEVDGGVNTTTAQQCVEAGDRSCSWFSCLWKKKIAQKPLKAYVPLI